MSTFTGPPGRRVIHMDPSDPEDLKKLTESGAIWATGPEYEQMAVNAIESGAIKVADCKNMPANIRKAIEG